MTTPKASSLPNKVILHPLVLLSAVDHYNRVGKDTNKRVVGVLLGSVVGDNNVNITSSFAIPFEEDKQSSWYADHNYLENFMTLHRKVTGEKVLGWYSSSPLIGANDLDVHEVFRRYCDEPVFLCINIKDHTKLLSQQNENQNGDTNQYSAPAKAFCSVALNKEEIQAKSTEKQSNPDEKHHNSDYGERRQFVHVHLEIGSDEAEEIGIEHVLRGIQQQHNMNPGAGNATLNDVLQNKVSALHGFLGKMRSISLYLDDVIAHKLPYNTTIINRIQDIISLVPVVANPQLTQALNNHTNDAMTVVYITSIIKTITSLHDLIKNKEVMLAAAKDEAVKKALVESTKINNNQKDAKSLNVGDEFDMDSVAHDRGDSNKH